MPRPASRSTASIRMRCSARSLASRASTPTSPTPTAGPTRWPVHDNSRERTMRADDRFELEALVKGLQALILRLERHREPLATQLLGMAVLELKRRIHGIDEEEFAALVDTVSGRNAMRPSNDP